MVQPRSRLLVGAAGADDHRRGRRRRRRRRSAATITAGGWRRGVQGVSFWGSDVGGGVRFGETTVDGARVDLTEYPLREGADRRRVAGDADAPLQPRRLRRRDDRHHPLQRRPPQLHHCVTDFAGNVGCTPDADRSRRQQPAGPPAQPRRLPAARAGAGSNDFDLAWANPDQGAASPIGGASWRIDGPAGYDSGVKFAPGRDLSALQNLFAAAGRPLLAQPLAARRGRQRGARRRRSRCRCASTTCRPASPSTPPATGAGCPSRSAPESPTTHSGPAGGELDYRRLESQQWTELPAKFQRGDAADAAQLVARLPGDLGARHLRLPRRGGRRRRQRGVDDPPRRRHRDDAAQGRAGRGGRGQAGGAGAGDRGRRRGSSPGCGWRGRSGTELTVPFGPRARSAAASLDADGAGLAGRTLRVVSRPSRGALARDPRRCGRDRRARRLPARLAAGPSRRIAVVLPRRGATSTRRPRPAHPAGARRRRLPGLASALQTGEAVRFWGRVAHARRAAPAARQAGRDPVLRVGGEALAPGARHPQRPQRPLPRQLPLPLRQRLGAHPPPRRVALRGALALRAGRLAAADRSASTAE